MKYVYKKGLYTVLFAMLDSAGGIVRRIFKSVPAKMIPSPGSLLVIRIDHIGDVVMATSVLAPLRKAFPQARIDLMVPSWAQCLLSDEASISGLKVFDAPWFRRARHGLWDGIRGFWDMVRIIKRGEYDAVVDLRGDARHILASFLAGVKYRISYGITGLGFLLTHEVPYDENAHEIDKNAALLGPLGIRCEEAQVRLVSSKESDLEAENIRKKGGIDRPYAVLHMVSGRKEKNWTPEGFAGVIDYLQTQKKLLPVIVGSKEDSVYIKGVARKTPQKVIDLSGKVNLNVLGPLMKNAEIFIGLDSAPAHIAAVSGVQTIILFSGVNDPARWAPRGENVRVIYPGEGKSLDTIAPEEVIREIG